MPPLHPPDPNGNFFQRSTTKPAWMMLPNFTFNITPTDRNRFPAPHAYTNTGRLTSDTAGNTFGYGPDGELLALIRPGATVAYRYNGVGERVARSATTGGGGGGQSTLEEFYFHDQAGDLLSLFDRTSPSNPAYSRLDFVRANGQLLYTAEHDPQPFPPPLPKYELAYLTDHLGSTRSVVQLNSSPPQQTYQEFEYFPYGYAKSEVTGLAFLPGSEPRVPVGFQGHLKEPGTELWYFKARYLHSGMGRFLTVDPVEDVDQAAPFTWNRYGFVRGNPMSLVDPSGLLTQAIVGGRSADNPLGHVGLAINGVVYSVGTNYTGGSDWGKSLESYLDAQENLRESSILTLDVTEEQESRLRCDLESTTGADRGYSLRGNTCATMLETALENAGILPSTEPRFISDPSGHFAAWIDEPVNSLLPTSFSDRLDQSSVVIGRETRGNAQVGLGRSVLGGVGLLWRYWQEGPP